MSQAASFEAQEIFLFLLQSQTFSFNPGSSVSKYSNLPDFSKISLLRQ